MKFSDLSNLEKLPKEVKGYIDVYLNEPLAFRIPAEPGWKAVILSPGSETGTDRVDFDIIPFYEWGFFSSLRFSELTYTKQINTALLRSQQEMTLPIMPKSYMGMLTNYFNHTAEYAKSWHRIPIPSLISGCLPPNDKRSHAEIDEIVQKLYKERKEVFESMSSMTDPSTGMDDLTKTLENIMGKSNVDKSKLN